MPIATESDQPRIISIIEESFEANPSVNIVIGEGGKRKRKIQRLAAYSFIKAKNRGGAYISSDGNGTALCFRTDKKVFSWKELIAEARFAISLAPSRIRITLKREAYIKKHRHKGAALYFWFLGVIDSKDGAVFELKDVIFKEAEATGLPILLETSVLRNVHAYQRYGFEIYHTWEDQENGNTLWFMRKLPSTI